VDDLNEERHSELLPKIRTGSLGKN
jgi:hypothetical protein